MKNQKILITGANSTIGRAFAKFLSADNEVWGVSRFEGADSQDYLTALGVKVLSIDFGNQDLSELPDDFDYVIHLAYFRGPKVSDIEQALRVNSEGTGFLLAHCRKAKAALYMSSSVIYSPADDPWHAFKEDDAIGGALPVYSVTAGISKVSAEVVARFCAKQFGLPVIIARLNAPYGFGEALLPVVQMDMVMNDKPIVVRGDPEPYSPIHLDDMCEQLEALLNAASIPATTVNWAGDEAVTVQDWCNLIGKWGNKSPTFNLIELVGTKKGNRSDPSKRLSITGPCKRKFEPSLKEIFDKRHGKS